MEASRWGWPGLQHSLPPDPQGLRGRSRPACPWEGQEGLEGETAQRKSTAWCSEEVLQLTQTQPRSSHDSLQTGLEMSCNPNQILAAFLSDKTNSVFV